jgi:hypothetical protein
MNAARRGSDRAASEERRTGVLNASTSQEIDVAFASLARERPDALFVSADGYLASRRVQFATLTARDKIPAVLFDS